MDKPDHQSIFMALSLSLSSGILLISYINARMALIMLKISFFSPFSA